MANENVVREVEKNYRYGRMTMEGAKSELRAVGVTVVRTAYGDYRVNLVGGSEDTAYYAMDLDDAVGTGKAMAAERDRRQ